MHMEFKEFFSFFPSFFFFLSSPSPSHLSGLVILYSTYWLHVYIYTQRDLDGWVLFYLCSLSRAKINKSSEKSWRYVNLVTGNHLIFERAFGTSHEPGRSFPDRNRNWGSHTFTLYYIYIHVYICWQKYQPCGLPICILHNQRDICVVFVVNRSFIRSRTRI